MVNKIKYCEKCKRYTLEEKCPICGNQTISKVPPRFSPVDRTGKYRRQIKKELLKKEGLL
ncbi:MAG: RNA-protein complex protein Nop10 [Nanoarchaeota archaeon]|nr:RNA-protein complex protein Nop10 [Nanoarchaeota archaeon]